MSTETIQDYTDPAEYLNTEEKYDSLLKDKIEEIRRICVREQIPCFMAFGLRSSNQEEGPYKIKSTVENVDPPKDQIKTVAIIPEVLPKGLKDRRFSDFINILNNFRAVPPSDYAKMTPEDVVIDMPSSDFRKGLELAANSTTE